jgi:hypothetical protein
MIAKEKKTATELVAMITDEIRLYPQYNDVVDITVSPAERGPANWTANYDVQASRAGPWPVLQEIDKLIRLFQDDFDLADEESDS